MKDAPVTFGICRIDFGYLGCGFFSEELRKGALAGMGEDRFVSIGDMNSFGIISNHAMKTNGEAANSICESEFQFGK